MEPISGLKVLVDLARAFRDELKSGKEVGPITLGTLLVLYGELSALADELVRMRKVISQDLDEIDNEERRFLEALFRRISQVGDALAKLDLAVLELFVPGASTKIDTLMRRDIAFHGAFSNYLAKTLSVRVEDLPQSFRIYEETLGIPAIDSGWRLRRLIDTEGAVQQGIDALAPAVDESRTLIGEIIKTHWTIKELGVVPK